MKKNLIKQKRFEQGISQIELAKKANISRTILSKIENDKANSTTLTLKKIARALGVEVAELLKEGDKNDN